MKIKRAVISVSEKMGVVEFAKALEKMGVEILSTGGTAKVLAENGVTVIEVGSFTGFPEMLDGRVKTLHPKVHGGILNVRDNAEHREQMEANGVVDIDLIVVNLYPFEATIAKPATPTARSIRVSPPATTRNTASITGGNSARSKHFLLLPPVHAYDLHNRPQPPPPGLRIIRSLALLRNLPCYE